LVLYTLRHKNNSNNDDTLITVYRSAGGDASELVNATLSKQNGHVTTSCTPQHASSRHHQPRVVIALDTSNRQSIISGYGCSLAQAHN